jgi:hypothetical protein
MSKYWYLAAAVIGVPATFVVAARHELGWTLCGIVSVGLNLLNYLNRLGE